MFYKAILNEIGSCNTEFFGQRGRLEGLRIAMAYFCLRMYDMYAMVPMQQRTYNFRAEYHQPGTGKNISVLLPSRTRKETKITFNADTLHRVQFIQPYNAILFVDRVEV